MHETKEKLLISRKINNKKYILFISINTSIQFNDQDPFGLQSL